MTTNKPEVDVQGEPVAWYLPSEGGYDSRFRDHATVTSCTGNPWEGWLPLYTAPQPAVQGEPLGWYTEDHLDDKSATTYSAEVAQRWRDKGWPVWPLYTTPQPAEREIPGSYPVSGQIFFRGASNEWVLELTGSVNGTTFTARHTQPADTRPEDVAGLPALYETAPDVEGLVEALELAHMALIGYLPSHRNDITDAAISHCEQALAAHRKGG